MTEHPVPPGPHPGLADRIAVWLFGSLGEAERPSLVEFGPCLSKAEAELEAET